MTDASERQRNLQAAPGAPEVLPGPFTDDFHKVGPNFMLDPATGALVHTPERRAKIEAVLCAMASSYARKRRFLLFRRRLRLEVRIFCLKVSASAFLLAGKAFGKIIEMLGE